MSFLDDLIKDIEEEEGILVEILSENIIQESLEHIDVQNIKGTSGLKCGCGSWIAHWEKITNKNVSRCVAAACKNKGDLVGAHVKKVADENSWSIIPLCKTHNASTEIFKVIQTTSFVSANVANSCGSN